MHPAEAQLYVFAKGSCHGSGSMIYEQCRSHPLITCLPIRKPGALREWAELYSVVTILHGYDRPECPLQIAQCSVHKSGALLLEDREGQYWDENLDRSCRAEEPAQQDCSLGKLRISTPEHLLNPDWPFSVAMRMSEVPIVSLNITGIARSLQLAALHSQAYSKGSTRSVFRCKQSAE